MSERDPDAEPEASAHSAQSTQWAQWIARIADGDEAALCALYDAALSRVYGMALRITREPSLAEDVVEEVFFKVWRNASRFDISRGAPVTWLLVICRSLALAKLRSADIAVSVAEIEDLVDECRDQAADPQSLLLAIEQHTILHRALQALGTRDRQLLALAFFRDLSYSEIAQQMTMPLGTVKTCIRSALRQLRESLLPMDLRG